MVTRPRGDGAKSGLLSALPRTILGGMFRCLSAGWTGFALCMLTGCSSLPVDAEPLRVSLSGLSIVDITLYEQRYLLTLRVQNPNPRTINIRGMDYEIFINGQRFAEGVDNQRIEISPFSETTIDVAVVSNTRRIIEQLTRLDQHRAFRYMLSGSVYLDGFGSLPFRYSGSLELAPEPDVEPARPIQTGIQKE